MGAETARNVSAFRVFRTRLREGFQDYRGPSVSIDALLTWATSRFTAIKVQHAPRAAGVSGYTYGKLIRHAFNLMTGFSTLPLQFASVVGFVFFLFGMSILAYVLVNTLIRGSAVPGFAFLASMTAIFSGAQLFALGIFGEYLARIHFRNDGPPDLRDWGDGGSVGPRKSRRKGSDVSHRGKNRCLATPKNALKVPRSI